MSQLSRPGRRSPQPRPAHRRLETPQSYRPWPSPLDPPACLLLRTSSLFHVKRAPLRTSTARLLGPSSTRASTPRRVPFHVKQTAPSVGDRCRRRLAASPSWSRLAGSPQAPRSWWSTCETRVEPNRQASCGSSETPLPRWFHVKPTARESCPSRRYRLTRQH